MSDIGERLDDAIDEVELNLTEDEVLSEPEEIEGDAELEERPELPEAVSEMNSKIMIDDYRDTFQKIYDPNKQKVTLPFLTKYEKTRILGIRAQQLSMGSTPLVPVNGMTSTIDIAMAELMQKKIPFIIKRILPDNTVEYWTINELQIQPY
jgi:DNA-directed RNA polymerase I, II, and III subunit RPABC2